MAWASQGARNLCSAAARVGQQQRRVSVQSAKYLKENADTTKLSSAEAEQLGAAKKPPGKSNSPGSFMYQQTNISNKHSKFLQPWLLPIYPMASMVAIGVGLAVMTAYREFTFWTVCIFGRMEVRSYRSREVIISLVALFELKPVNILFVDVRHVVLISGVVPTTFTTDVVSLEYVASNWCESIRVSSVRKERE